MCIRDRPNAVLTLMSGGASDAAQLGGASGSTVSNVIQEAMKNPSFWSSFMRTAGASYEDAKASGANELAATVYGITNGLVSSGIEVGGGVEGRLDKNGLGGVLQTMYCLLYTSFTATKRSAGFMWRWPARWRRACGRGDALRAYGKSCSAIL